MSTLYVDIQLFLMNLKRLESETAKLYQVFGAVEGLMDDFFHKIFRTDRRHHGMSETFHDASFICADIFMKKVRSGGPEREPSEAAAGKADDDLHSLLLHEERGIPPVGDSPLPRLGRRREWRSSSALPARRPTFRGSSPPSQPSRSLYRSKDLGVWLFRSPASSGS